MFLIPRLIGVTIYTLLLLLVCIFISKTNMRDRKIVIWFYVICLSMMGYFYVPYITADLYRLLPIMHHDAAMTISQLTERMISTGTPMVPLYYYCIGQLGVDGMLPAITAFITFALCFSIIMDFSKKNNINRKAVAIAIFVLMSRGFFYQTISTIRTVLSLSIISWCIYQEKVNNKNPVSLLLLMSIAALFHVIGQFVFLCWLIYIFVEKRGSISNFQKILFGCFLLGLFVLYSGNILDAFLEKGEGYAKLYQTGEGYSSKWETILSFGTIAIVGYSLGKFKQMYKEKLYANQLTDTEIGLNRLSCFLMLFTTMNVIMYFVEFNMFFRTSYFLMMLVTPIILYVVSIEIEHKKAKTYNALLIMSSIILIIACVRGDLSALKFFE